MFLHGGKNPSLETNPGESTSSKPHRAVSGMGAVRVGGQRRELESHFKSSRERAKDRKRDFTLFLTYIFLKD